MIQESRWLIPKYLLSTIPCKAVFQAQWGDANIEKDVVPVLEELAARRGGFAAKVINASYLCVTCKRSVTLPWENHCHLQKSLSELPQIVYLCPRWQERCRTHSVSSGTDQVYVSFICLGPHKGGTRVPLPVFLVVNGLFGRGLSCLHELCLRAEETEGPAHHLRPRRLASCLFSTGAWKSKWIMCLLYHITLPLWRSVGKGFFSGSRYQGKLWSWTGKKITNDYKHCDFYNLLLFCLCSGCWKAQRNI